MLNKNTEYTGDFQMGQKHGKGIMVESSGAVYDGEFRDNEKNGEGTLTLKDKTYKGSF